MSTNFAIIGGDLRIVELTKLLAKEGNYLYSYGLEKAEELKGMENVSCCRTMKQAVKNAEIVIGPIPFSRNGKDINSPYSENKILIDELIHSIPEKVLIAGSIGLETHHLANHANTKIIDLMEREELAILNTIATAEGTIEVAMSHTNKIIQGSKILIIGFGRIGKILASKMKALSAKVTCAARKPEDIAWIQAYGYQANNSNELGENLSEYDIIINTVPHLILTAERLQYVKQECLLIDLASKPGGMDQEVVKQRNLKFIWALGLPGKVAPVTSAEFIKNIIDTILC